jgi:hypothetical protein
MPVSCAQKLLSALKNYFMYDHTTSEPGSIMLADDTLYLLRKGDGMVSKDGKLKKTAALITICSFITSILMNTAWASFPNAEEETIFNFANRLGKLIPACGEEEITIEQLLDIYSKAESLKNELAAASADLALQESQSECTFIKTTALVCLMLGTQAVLSFATAYIRITITPPTTPLSTVRAYLSITKKAVYMLAVAPKAIVNSMLMQMQYWECKKEL